MRKEEGRQRPFYGSDKIPTKERRKASAMGLGFPAGRKPLDRTVTCSPGGLPYTRGGTTCPAARSPEPCNEREPTQEPCHGT